MKKEDKQELIEVTLIEDCTHAGEACKKGDKVKVTKGQLDVMRSFNLIDGDK